MTVTKLPPLNLNPHCGRSFKGAASRKETSLLGDLHVDKIYLEKLLQNPGNSFWYYSLWIDSLRIEWAFSVAKGLRHQSGSTQKIINHAKDTLEYLKSRENFWRQQQPSAISYPIIKENRGIKIGKKVFSFFSLKKKMQYPVLFCSIRKGKVLLIRCHSELAILRPLVRIERPQCRVAGVVVAAVITRIEQTMHHPTRWQSKL